jgi:hypothetical protein
MFGLSIIKESELRRLRDIDEVFEEKIGKLTAEVNLLKGLVERFTPRRGNNGKFVKKVSK